MYKCTRNYFYPQRFLNLVHPGGRPRSYIGPRVQIHIFITEEKQKIIDDLAGRENLTRTQLLVQITDDYIRAHGAGNNSYKLEEFDKGLVRAFPTAWKKWNAETDLTSDFNDAEFAEMEDLLAHNLKIVRSKRTFVPREEDENQILERAKELLVQKSFGKIQSIENLEKAKTNYPHEHHISFFAFRDISNDQGYAICLHCHRAFALGRSELI